MPDAQSIAKLIFRLIAFNLYRLEKDNVCIKPHSLLPNLLFPEERLIIKENNAHNQRFVVITKTFSGDEDTRVDVGMNTK